MATKSEKERVGAVKDREPGQAARELPRKQKRIMNLKEESQHLTGHEKLAAEEKARDIDNGS